MSQEQTTEERARELHALGYLVRKLPGFDTADQYEIITPEGERVVMNHFTSPSDRPPYMKMMRGEDPNLPEDVTFVPVIEALARMRGPEKPRR